MRGGAPDRLRSFESCEILVDLERAASVQACQSLLRSKLADLGIANFGYVRMNPPMVEDRSYVFSSYDPDWLSHYVEQDYVFCDPLVLEARKTLTPIIWSEVNPLPVRTARQAQFMKEAAANGFRRGIAIPIRGFRGEFAMMSMILEEPSGHAFTAFCDEYKYLLLLASLYFHHEIWRRIENGAARTLPELTARQVEILRLGAAGKTAWEISVILGLSEDGVRYHIREAGRKLGTFGITATIAKAIAYGYFSP
ncbi:MAG: LuxR family transcriptional regulator [Rhodothalassiaceae bacterium]